MMTPPRMLLLALLAGCGESPAGVRIVAPAEGAVVAGSSVHVVLAATGIHIAPVAEQRAGTGHHHLFLDVDPSPAGQPIPGGPGVVHLGGGQTEYTFADVAPGPHRLIAVLGDLKHVPVEAAVADTAYFTVGAP